LNRRFDSYVIDVAHKTDVGYFTVKDFKDKIVKPEQLRQLARILKENFTHIFRVICVVSDILTQSKIDISKPINYISAKQIKQITNEDTRLMAKIDKMENLPKVFRENNLFILPVSRKEYAIVRGTGYHS
jgi:hypothetical protein